MRSVMSRIVCFFLTAVLLVLCLAQTADPARADFENTYINTGDQRADLIGVALTQVGYREGSNNYTKYGVWYGAPNTAWCGMFVSWCANQAGIPTSVLRKNGFASASGFGLSRFYVSDRLPRGGDLFFKTDGSHTGIVYYVDGNYFYTIEGNTNDNGYEGIGVFVRKRNLYGSYYFASPNYQSDSGHSYQKYYESTHPHKEYYKCSDCGSSYYTGATGTVSDCKQCKMASCTHSYSNWTYADDDTHKATCSLCSKVTYFKHDWGSDRILTEATCEKEGSKWQKCNTCGATHVVEIPQTDDHQYGDWLYVDTQEHSRVCDSCGRERTAEHTAGQWLWDSSEHWAICEDCEGRVKIGAHEFKNGCTSGCAVCGYTQEGGHAFSQEWESGESGHWHTCDGCGAKDEVQPHTYSADCDESCDVCGYLRQTTHSYEESWSSDGTGHWHSCSVCGQTDGVQPHTVLLAAARMQEQVCSTCQYVVTAAPLHIHSYAYSSNASTHWGTCDCGQVLEPEGHIWDMETGKCTLCQAQLPAQKPQTEIPWEMVLPAVAAVAVLTAAGIVIGTWRKKRTARLKAELDAELAQPVTA